MLSGHSDVSTDRRSELDQRSFKLAARDSRLYARGACDMKGLHRRQRCRVCPRSPQRNCLGLCT